MLHTFGQFKSADVARGDVAVAAPEKEPKENRVLASWILALQGADLACKRMVDPPYSKTCTVNHSPHFYPETLLFFIFFVLKSISLESHILSIPKDPFPSPKTHISALQHDLPAWEVVTLDHWVLTTIKL